MLHVVDEPLAKLTPAAAPAPRQARVVLSRTPTPTPSDARVARARRLLAQGHYDTAEVLDRCIDSLLDAVAT